jgi:hypothetical protein
MPSKKSHGGSRFGAGRPKSDSGPAAQYAFRLSVEERELLKRVADELDSTESDVLRDALADFAKRNGIL